MAESSDILLNPDVLDGNQSDAVPRALKAGVMAQWGLPVFDPEIEEQIETAEQEETQELKEIRSQVFENHVDGTAQTVGQIRSQLFQTEPSLTKTEIPDRTTDSGDYFLVIEFMVMGFLILLLFYQRYRQKKRKEVQDDINDYGK